MKILVVLLLLASLGANFWQYQRASEMEESWNLQRATITKQKKLVDQTTKDIQAEKQNTSRTVKSAQGLLDRSEKLMNELDRLAAENAVYRQRLAVLDGGTKTEVANRIVAVAPTPTPVPSSVLATPTPTPANGKKKK